MDRLHGKAEAYAELAEELPAALIAGDLSADASAALQRAGLALEGEDLAKAASALEALLRARAKRLEMALTDRAGQTLRQAVAAKPITSAMLQRLSRAAGGEA